VNSEVWREKFWNGPTEEVNWHSESWLLLLWEYNHGLAGKHGVTSFYDLIVACSICATVHGTGME